MDLKELLDVQLVNLVAVLLEPYQEPSNPAALFQSNELGRHFKRPITYTSGLTIGADRGAAPSHIYESMKSQRTVSLSGKRIEIADHSGSLPTDSAQLHEAFIELLRSLRVRELAAIGSNSLVLFTPDAQQPASRLIAASVFRTDRPFTSRPAKLAGGGARLIFEMPEGDATCSMVVEPRLNDPQTTEVWANCNVNAGWSSVPTAATLLDLTMAGYQVFYDVLGTMFPVIREAMSIDASPPEDARV